MKAVFLLFALCLGSNLVLAQDEPATTEAEQVQAQLRDYFFNAARFGDNEMLDEFIQAGFDLNAADDKGYSALILAAYNGHADAVEQLLGAGADACAEDKRGNTRSEEHTSE